MRLSSELVELVLPSCYLLRTETLRVGAAAETGLGGKKRTELARLVQKHHGRYSGHHLGE